MNKQVKNYTKRLKVDVIRPRKGERVELLGRGKSGLELVRYTGGPVDRYEFLNLRGAW